MQTTAVDIAFRIAANVRPDRPTAAPGGQWDGPDISGIRSHDWRETAEPGGPVARPDHAHHGALRNPTAQGYAEYDAATG